MCFCLFIFFFKQKTAYEMRISDWSSDVCSSDLIGKVRAELDRVGNLIIDTAHLRQRLEAALELVAIAEVPAIAAIADGILPGAVFDAALGFANVAALDQVALAAEPIGRDIIIVELSVVDRKSNRLNSRH